MGNNDVQYVYGDANGKPFALKVPGEEPKRLMNWDPRISVQPGTHWVNVGVTPPSEASTDEGGVWKTEDGQFLMLDREGLNRLIRALQDAGAAVFGRDAW